MIGGLYSLYNSLCTLSLLLFTLCRLSVGSILSWVPLAVIIMDLASIGDMSYSWLMADFYSARTKSGKEDDFIELIAFRRSLPWYIRQFAYADNHERLPLMIGLSIHDSATCCPALHTGKDPDDHADAHDVVDCLAKHAINLLPTLLITNHAEFHACMKEKFEAPDGHRGAGEVREESQHLDPPAPEESPAPDPPGPTREVAVTGTVHAPDEV